MRADGQEKSLRGKSMATAVRPRHRELCLCCLVRRKVGRQLVVEPQQICIEPPMSYDVICHYGFRDIGQIAGPAQPTGFRAEQGAVDGDSKMLACYNVSDPAQAVLPTLTDSRRVFAGDIRCNAAVRLMRTQ